MTAAEIYAKQVLEGKIVTGIFIKQAAQRFLDFLERDDIEYDIVTANKVVNWIEGNLVHWEGEWRGKPFILEPWQKFMLQQIFGLKKDGRRLITKAYIQVSRKNTKTTMSAAIAAYHLFADTEQSPQVLVGANNEDQAKLCTTCCANILEISPKFRGYIDNKLIKIFRFKDKCSSITYPKNNGRIEAISRDLKTKDGSNPSLGIIDEYMEADNPGLLNVIRSGQAARLNPLLIVITTAGSKKEGPCYSQLRKVSVEVLNGLKTDDSQLAIIYELDAGDDYRDPEIAIKANPNYGVSVYANYLKERVLEAKNEGASKEVDVRTKNFNEWTDVSTVWISDHIWMKNNTVPITNGITFHSGLDIAVIRDWSAWVLVGKDLAGDYHIHPYFWIPEETVQYKLKNENSNLLDWIEQGLVFTTPGNVTDHDLVSQFILEKSRELNVQDVLADKAYCISIMNQLNAAGLECLAVNQTPTQLTQPTTLFYELVMEGRIKHGGNPVLRWMMASCILKEYTSGLSKVMKEKNTKNKIDGIDALINGLVPYAIEQEEVPQLIIGKW